MAAYKCALLVTVLALLTGNAVAMFGFGDGCACDACGGFSNAGGCWCDSLCEGFQDCCDGTYSWHVERHQDCGLLVSDTAVCELPLQTTFLAAWVRMACVTRALALK